MLIFCTPAEVVRDIKQIVLESEGFWLGAFSFVRVPPPAATQNSEESAPLANGDHSLTDVSNEPYGDWKEIGSIFAGKEYEDPATPRTLRIVQSEQLVYERFGTSD